MALFTAAAFLFRFRSRQFPQKFLRLFTSGLRQAVMRPLSLLPAFHDSGFTQHLHVIGKAGLADIHLILQHAGTFLAAAQLLQNLQTPRVAQRLKNLGILFK